MFMFDMSHKLRSTAAAAVAAALFPSQLISQPGRQQDICLRKLLTKREREGKGRWGERKSEEYGRQEREEEDEIIMSTNHRAMSESMSCGVCVCVCLETWHIHTWQSVNVRMHSTLGQTRRRLRSGVQSMLYDHGHVFEGTTHNQASY